MKFLKDVIHAIVGMSFINISQEHALHVVRKSFAKVVVGLMNVYQEKEEDWASSLILSGFVI